jgi:antitoxin component HigA of HigAB toxin-antitoxin module
LKTDDSSKSKVDKLLKKNKILTLDDWELLITTHGIPADAVSYISGQPVPENFYYYLS